jgi:two-component system sensor histidine kinase AlgZ
MGWSPARTGAQIRISTQRRGSGGGDQGDQHGAGRPGAARARGLALDNVRDRLRLLHDVQGTFRTALVDGVYQVRIEVPLPHEGGAP